ncbi:hypothetical protein ACFPYJ_24655 [Paenibacillus solisilvae]|uniref:Uncharacterized protein n=1 Tax=Paenibacillus solisilvae TaxID=2486751 RepID=A0ABW0W6Z3_9BACL
MNKQSDEQWRTRANKQSDEQWAHSSEQVNLMNNGAPRANKQTNGQRLTRANKQSDEQWRTRANKQSDEQWRTPSKQAT